MNQISIEKIVALWIFLILIILTIALAIFHQNSAALPLLIVPLIYGLLYIFGAEIFKYYAFPGMFLMNVICAIRYVVIPTLVLLDANYQYSDAILSSGIYLMIYEEIIVGLFLNFFVKNQYEKYKNFLGTITHGVSARSGWIFKVILIVALIVLYFEPMALSKFNFVFFSTDLEIYRYGEAVSGIGSLILDWSKLILPLVLSSFLIKIYQKKKITLIFYLTITCVLFFNLMIFTGISRNSAILPGVASLFFLTKIFPAKKKEIFALVSLMIIGVTVALTILKNEYIGGASQSYSFSSITNYFEIYFAGPLNLGFTVETAEAFVMYYDITTLINDIFANIPGLSNYFDLENRTSAFFNLFIYKGGASRDQIIPTIGQGIFYFGYMFSFLPELLFIWLMTKFDKGYSQSRDIMSAFLMSYFAVRFGFSYIQNVSILAGFFFTTLIPCWVMLMANKKTNISLF